MDFGIKGKNALVTGAGRGIGKSIAIQLANEGANVCVVSRTKEDLVDVVREMEETSNGKHMAVEADLMDEEAILFILDKFYYVYNSYPDILINNVGDTLGIKDPLCSNEDWHKIWRIDVETMIDFCREVIPTMQKKGWGRIVNISSIAGMHNQGPVTHCVMKTAMLAYTRSMGRIYAKDGIVISSVMPGAIMTEGGHWDKASKEHVDKYLKDNCPLGKFGEPDDIGSIVVMLCSQQAKFCQGTLMPVDGGQSKHFFWTRDY